MRRNPGGRGRVSGARRRNPGGQGRASGTARNPDEGGWAGRHAGNGGAPHTVDRLRKKMYLTFHK
jgi:hypothetical protein